LRIGDVIDESIQVEIPDDLLIHSSGDHILTNTHDCIYPSILTNTHDPTFFELRAILTPKNGIVDEINEYVMSLIPGEEKTYLSSDSPIADSTLGTKPDEVHTPEFLNTINSSGLPNHKLTLKIGVPLMLLRNMDITAGLCNRTRLIITKMGMHVLEEKVISGSNVGERVYIPRLSLTPSDTRIPFKFQRRKFLITVCFAMIINKSQGQSLNHVGIYIPQPVFSHGQLCVAVSRVTSRNGLEILLTNENGDDINTTTNVVYKKIFQNM